MKDSDKFQARPSGVIGNRAGIDLGARIPSGLSNMPEEPSGYSFEERKLQYLREEDKEFRELEDNIALGGLIAGASPELVHKAGQLAEERRAQRAAQIKQQEEEVTRAMKAREEEKRGGRGISRLFKLPHREDQ